MIGQDRIILALKSNLPHTINLIGEYGSGRHTLINEISVYYKYPIIDITDSIMLETLNNISLYPLSRIYIIDVDKITIKQQNMLLKTLEEPSDSAYFCLLSTPSSLILPTITNRCQSYVFELYNKEQLSCFLTTDKYKNLILNSCITPGQVKFINISNIDTLYKLCFNIVDSLKQANYSNALSIASKINYADDYDKYDLNVFMNILAQCLIDKYKLTRDDIYFNMYATLINYHKYLNNNKYNKKYIIESMISKLWQEN